VVLSGAGVAGAADIAPESAGGVAGASVAAGGVGAAAGAAVSGLLLQAESTSAATAALRAIFVFIDGSPK